MAVSAHSYRPPLRGEWYLSGAIIEAWLAPNDLTASYPIARLVSVQQHQLLRAEYLD